MVCVLREYTFARLFTIFLSVRTYGRSVCHRMSFYVTCVCDEFNGYGIEFVGRALKYDEDDMRSIQCAIFSSSCIRSEQ